MTATQAFRNALHVPTADPAAGRTVTVATPGDEYVATWQIAGGIPEAPADGQLYGREGLAEDWQPILPQPAADILDALKTVDGPGSGLDADTVDGYHAAYLVDWYSLTNAPSTFPPQLPIPMSGVTDLDAALLAKADLAYVDAKDALKANTSYVDAADALKADTTYVDGQDAALDVRLDAVETDKANIDYVDAADAAIQADLDSKVEEAPIDGLQYARSDAGWVEVVATGGGGAATSIGDEPPADPVDGQLWWESDSGSLFIWYSDADSSQWVPAAIGMPGPAGPPGGLGEAPIDGQQYARSDAAWEVIVGGASDWADLTGKPSTFPPEAHGHATSEITGLDAALTAKADLTYVNARTPKITVASTAPSTPAVGDVWIDTT